MDLSHLAVQSHKTFIRTALTRTNTPVMNMGGTQSSRNSSFSLPVLALLHPDTQVTCVLKPVYASCAFILLEYDLVNY